MFDDALSAGHAATDARPSLQIKAIVLSGSAAMIDLYAERDLAGLRAVLCEAAWPTLGLCGGHQLMGQTFGRAIEPMGPLPPGAPDPYPEWEYGQGMKRERGFMPVRVIEPHPLFDGLGDLPVMFESHFWEVNGVPEGFRLHASTETCPVQMMAHATKPLFGTQFHPEQWDDAHPDGKRLLLNFFRLAGII
jgi:GMP synthase (glutamine-hydrolysing)